MIRPFGLPASALVVARSPHFILSLILLLTFLVYAPVLDDWFGGDDFFYLRAAQLKSPLEFLTESFDFRDTTEPADSTGGQYRPLYVFTIVAEGELFGSHALPYHLVNLLIHVANAALVWLIARKVTQRPLIAHIAALVFSVHPTYSSVVGSISELSALAATLGALVCLWAFMKALDGGAQRKLWYLISVTSYLAAMLYHPKAAPVLVALVAYYFLIHPGNPNRRLSPRAWLRFAPYVGIVLFPLFVGLLVRSEFTDVQRNFGYGPHVYKNYLHFLVMGVVPYPFLASDRLLGAATPTFTAGIIAFFAWIGMGGWPLRDGCTRAAHLFALLWLLTAILPLTLSIWGAPPRQFYIAGPAFAIVLSLFFVNLLDSLSKVRFSRVVLASVLLVCLVLASQWMFTTQQDRGRHAAQSQDFIEELRQTYPTLPADAALYVVDAPFSLRVFDNVYLVKAISLYYGDIRVEPVSQTRAQELELSPQPNERVFRYSGYD